MKSQCVGNWVCAFVVVAMLSGCGSSGSSSNTVPASGVATYKGTPLAHYQLFLIQQDVPYAIAATDEAGKFEFGTFKPGDGAIPGTHKLFVTYVGPKLDDDYAIVPPSKIKLPQEYFDATKSSANVDVPASGSKDLKIELK